MQNSQRDLKKTVRVYGTMKRQEKWELIQSEAPLEEEKQELDKKSLRNFGKFILRASTAIIKNQLPKKF